MADVTSLTGRVKYTAYFNITGSSSTVNDGAADGAFTKNGTGDYTLTFTTPFAKVSGYSLVLVQGTSEKLFGQVRAAGDAVGSVRILTYDAANTNAATDCKFYLQVTGELDPY